MITAQIEPIDRDIAAMIDRTLSVSAQISEFVDFALESKAAAQLIDEKILGHAVTVKQWVDGVLGAAEQAVEIYGTIVYEFGLVNEVLQFIGEELQKHSPIGSGLDQHPGLYQLSHILFADGVQVPIDNKIPEAREYTFVNTLPYSRKIEAGYSSQAPNGVYEVVAWMARQRFGNVAKITYDEYIGVVTGVTEHYNLRGNATKVRHNKAMNRFPAIRVAV